MAFVISEVTRIEPGATTDTDIEPGRNADVQISGSIVVAEIIVPVAGSAEKVWSDDINIEADCGSVIVPRTIDDDGIKVAGSEENATATDRPVPVTTNVDIAGRSPVVGRGNPSPARLIGDPITRPPHVTGFAIDP